MCLAEADVLVEIDASGGRREVAVDHTLHELDGDLLATRQARLQELAAKMEPKRLLADAAQHPIMEEVLELVARPGLCPVTWLPRSVRRRTRG